MDESLDIDAYPQLAFIAWNRRERRIQPKEALSLYESAPAWVDPSNMQPHERALFERLVRELGQGVYLG